MPTYPSLAAWLTQQNAATPGLAWARNAELGWGGSQEDDDTTNRAFQTWFGLQSPTQSTNSARNALGLRNAFQTAHIADPTLTTVDWLSGNGPSNFYNSLSPFQAGRQNPFMSGRWRG
jgi:hypothetical protein